MEREIIESRLNPSISFCLVIVLIYTKQLFRNDDDDDDDDDKMMKMSAPTQGYLCAKPFTHNILSVLTITPQRRYFHYSHSTDEKTEAK